MNTSGKKGTLCMLLCALIVACGSISLSENVSKTTGLKADGPYRPVLVNLSNSEDAQPIHGIGAADVVYEAIIWGPGHTRYLAVFNDEHPEAVGSIRGTRLYQAQIRQGWDAPFAYRGGQEDKGSNYLEYMDAQGVPGAFRIDEVHAQSEPAAALYFKQEGYEHPHNSFVKLREYVNTLWPETEDGTPYAPHDPGLVFSADAPTKGEAVATRVDIRYDEPATAKPLYNPSYAYDAATRMYVRSYNGAPQMDGIDDRQVVAANIIVQYCDLQYNGSAASPVMTTTGEGEMHAYIGGTRIDGTWKRQTDDDPTQYLDAEGNPLALLPGKTFVQIVPPAFDAVQDGDAFSYTWAEGAKLDTWTP